jgi:hypothetical protein
MGPVLFNVVAVLIGLGVAIVITLLVARWIPSKLESEDSQVLIIFTIIISLIAIVLGLLLDAPAVLISGAIMFGCGVIARTIDLRLP